jgi:membrane-associated phospholipid phosphatase
VPEFLSLPTKATLLVVGYSLWLLQYFLINGIARPRRPWSRPRTAADALFPFVPGFILVYLTTYLFGALPPLLVAETDLFIRLIVAYGVITLVAATIHVVYPSEIERADVRDQMSLANRLLARFQRFCRPCGNFPSIHVAFSALTVLTGFAVGGQVVGWLLLAWAVLIAVSTLVTKQHYVLDVVSGGILGGGVTAAALLVPGGQREHASRAV